MKLCLSNLAWDKKDDAQVARVLVEARVDAVELAPTKVVDRPLEAGEAFWRDCRQTWKDRGLVVAALQAILFGRPELTVFGSEEVRRATRLHLKGMSRLASWLGAGVLVLGAPKNRLRGTRPMEQAMAEARDFFAGVGEDAAREGVKVCIEPNPPAYACDFVTQSDEGRELVRLVDSPGFGLHLDVAGMTMAGEDPAAAIRAARGAYCHFHASEPELGPLGEGGVDHAAAARALQETGYAGFVSVEMREVPGRPIEAEIRRVARFLRETYG